MASLTKEQLERLLTKRLSLRDPEFHLEKVGGQLVGHVISASFRGKRDLQRLNAIWDVLEAELRPELLRRVGMLLAYTPEEWNLGDEPKARPKRVKKAG